MTLDTRSRRWLVACLLVAFGALLLRSVWLTADPPTRSSVGVVWHDEGAWVHNARNRALFGTWRTDAWNPMYLTPVFTGLEYVAFEAFGVGTWQARTVPVVSGLLAVWAVAWGLAVCAGRRAALIGMTLVATSYLFVMWNRAALMESTMTAFIALSWAAYARASRRPAWGLVAGAACVLAFFTKAAAAFFVAALVIEAAGSWLLTRLPRWRDRLGVSIDPAAGAGARWTLVGLAAAGGLALVAFVLPYWTEVRFYNWQMSVTRKPEYTIGAFLDRASWLPVIHHVFTRMWPALAAASAAIVLVVAGWRRSTPALRLLVLWVLIGLAELVVHDSGNERRYVMFVPAVAALAASFVGGARLTDRGDRRLSARSAAWLTAPVVLLVGYLVWGSLIRLLFLDQIDVNDLSLTVRLSAGLAVLSAGVVLVFWQRLVTRLAGWRPGVGVAVGFTTVMVVLDGAQFADWASRRTDLNYQASVALGERVAPGTLVHGKLANGLSLENRIRPVFVGNGFGNYDDRLQRDDVRYLLTYNRPRWGYEGPIILEVLDHYPQRRILWEFPVNETPGRDTAVLIEK